MPEQDSHRVWSGQPWRTPMRARLADEEHRSATPLELFFDLCFVVAVSLAGSRLHNGLISGNVGQPLVAFGMVFFAIWWAWMNFTWFASAYDTDDGVYRLTTLVQIAGALVLAAGVPSAFDERDFTTIAVGYVLMRLAMVGQWLRAARSDRRRRPGSLRYAIGIAIVQGAWLLWLTIPAAWQSTVFVILAVAELLVPIWAERAAATTWHPGHITERYGLFTLIVLGESVLAATTALQSGFAAGQRLPELFVLAGSGLLIVFAMWWLYFEVPVGDLLSSLPTAIAWGYGHLLIFASAAAVGAGLQLAVDFVVHRPPVPLRTIGLATAAPVAVYVVMVWLLHVIPQRIPLATLAFPAAAALVILAPLTSAPVPVVAGVLILLIVATSFGRRVAPRRGSLEVA